MYSSYSNCEIEYIGHQELVILQVHGSSMASCVNLRARVGCGCVHASATVGCLYALRHNVYSALSVWP